MFELRKIELASHTAATIFWLRILTTVTELSYYLGVCKVFRRIVAYFTRIALPLSKQLCKSQSEEPVPLTEEVLSVLGTPEEKLFSAPVLTVTKSNRLYTLDSGACDGQVGCLLVQRQSNITTKTVRYWPDTLQDHEKTRCNIF